MRIVTMISGLALALGAAPVLAQQAPNPTAEELKPQMQSVKTTPNAAAEPIPAMTPENTLNLDLSTGGRVVVQLRPDKAPLSVERIKLLTRRGFYNGLKFHRVVEGFMAQVGDPKGDGTGGSELPDLKAEFNNLPHVRGVMSMARTDAPDTANSQFFLMFSPNLRLDGKYTAIGRVTAGMAFVDAIERGEPPAVASTIVRAGIAADGDRPVAVAPAAARGAAAAAADAASLQAADAKVAAEASSEAAKAGDTATATERANAARTSSQGAAEALDDAAQALKQAPPAPPR